MMTDSLLTRRRLLQLTGSTAVVGLAGCTSADSTGSPTDETATPTDHHDDGGTEAGHDDDAGHHDEEESGHGGESHGHDESVGEPTETADVTMVTQDGGSHFEPHVVRVTPGGTVTWELESGSHDTTAYHPDNDQPQLVPDGATAWDSSLLSEAGATFEHTFETEGVYHYYCTPHESVGMIGSVIVGEPDAHGQPALEDPPADKPEAVRTKLEELNAMCNEALGHNH